MLYPNRKPPLRHRNLLCRRPHCHPPSPVALPIRTTVQKRKVGFRSANNSPKSSNAIVALNQAKGELDRGDIPAALDALRKLIKKGKHLEETIRDLTESIYRYPVELVSGRHWAMLICAPIV